MTFILPISPKSGHLEANYVTVVKVRPLTVGDKNIARVFFSIGLGLFGDMLLEVTEKDCVKDR